MKRGFTLAEVMVALLILAIILAASAPIITKKTIRTAGGAGNNPWQFIGNTQNTRFNATGSDVTAMIGHGVVPSVQKPPRLVINSVNNSVGQIDLYRDGSKKGSVAINDKGYFFGNYPIVNSVSYGSGATTKSYSVTDTVVLGNITSYGGDSVAIGNNVISGVKSVAIGYNTNSNSVSSIAVGKNATAGNTGAIAIGTNSNSSGLGSIALGANSTASNSYSVAVGHNASALGEGSYVLGYNSSILADNSILIARNTAVTNTDYTCNYGGSNHSISPSSKIILGSNTTPTILVGNSYSTGTLYATTIQTNSLTTGTLENSSDLRLKNLGNEYTQGMDKLNQLKIYNYTFKNEPKKKRVGVVAQELMKIFPNAVSKNTDGYYTIRQEDIFYTMVNAIKEINVKIAKLIEDIKNPSEKTVLLSNKISDLDTQIKQQKDDIKNLKRRVWLLKLRTAYLK